MTIARPETMPVGDAFPFGAMGLDIGTQWFRDLSLKGYLFKNYEFGEIAKHAWASETDNGHSALFNADLYENSEAIAKEKLIRDFNIADAALCRG